MYTMLTIEEFCELEDLVAWNLSFGISPKETLSQIKKLEYLDLFLI